MSTVYEGLDPAGGAVAVKTIDKALIEADELEDVCRRFDQEAQVVGQLRHPGIVSVYDHGEAGEVVFMVMEFVDGTDLADYWAQQAGHRAEDAADILRQILDALDYSHRRGVIHRDIKPENILVTRDGRVKVSDFGIAKIESSSLTLPGTVYGTPFYMSPEQFAGPVDVRSDVYSAGVVLYELLTGIKPFTGESLPDIVYKVTHETPRPPSAINPAIPEMLDRIVLKAIARRPSDRYQSAGEFRDALGAAVEAGAAAAPSSGPQSQQP